MADSRSLDLRDTARNAGCSPMPASTKDNISLSCLALGCVIIAMFHGCARKLPPSGGPPDLTPPVIVGMSPDSAQAAVPRDAAVELEFSEHMDKRSVEDWLFVRPSRNRPSLSWKGRKLIARIPGGLEADRTYQVVLGRNAKDRHGNMMESTFELVFSTSPEVPAGALAGRLIRLSTPIDNNLVFVWNPEWSDTVITDPLEAQFISYTNAEGRFRMTGLQERQRYVLGVFYDQNKNRIYDAAQDFVSMCPDTIELTPGADLVAEVEWRFFDPESYGSISGVLSDSLWTDEYVSMMFTHQTDSTLVYRTSLEVPGAFVIPQVIPGRFDATVFVDEDRDGTLDGGELARSYRWGPFAVAARDSVNVSVVGLWQAGDEEEHGR